LCLNCLRSKHFAKNCIAGNCKICGKRHSSLLHIETDKGKQNKDEQSSLKQEHRISESNEKSSNVSCHHTKIEEGTISRQVLLSTAEVRIRDKNGQFIEGRALLDSGSQSNFISESCIDKLELRYNKSQIKIHGINQQISRVLKVVDLEVSSRFGSFTTSLRCVVLPCITQNLLAVKIRSELDIPSNIRLADPKYYIPKEVDLLIGAEKFWDLICAGQIKLGKNKPILQKSTLGWIIVGIIAGREKKGMHSSCHLSIGEDLTNAINKFWQIEDCLSRENLTAEEKYTEECFKNNYVRNEEGRFVQ